MHEAVKLERERRKTLLSTGMIDLAKTLVSNPAFEIIATFVIIEQLQKTGHMPQLAGTIAEGGVLTAVGMQQLAPLAPYIAQGAQGLGATIKTLTPLLAAGLA